MKYSVVILLLLVFAGCHQQSSDRIQFLKASSKSIFDYSLDGKETHRFEIAEQDYLNEIKIECGKDPVLFMMKTELDSIQVKVNQGDSIHFYIIVDNQDSVSVNMIGIPKNVNFTDEYISLHKGKVEVLIPEVHELVNIMVAISDIGQKDSNMVDMTTDYYKEVMEHFSPFAAEEMMVIINENITKVLDEDSYVYYFSLKMNACGYVFNPTGNIVDDGIIHRMGFSFSEDPILKHVQQIQDFSEKSGFRKFYKEHQPYYHQLIEEYNELIPIAQMQQWLERKFNMNYGSYKVTFSPLVGKPNSTQKYEDNGFSQTVMYVSKALYDNDYNKKVNEILQSNVVFTEIDHNFVNPTSEKYVDEINKAFEDRGKWVQEGPMSSIYGNPSAVFNEYMTWAVFSLYCEDYFDSNDIKIGTEQLIAYMENNRGFYQYGQFNNELVKKYAEDKSISMEAIYSHILNWSLKQ